MIDATASRAGADLWVAAAASAAELSPGEAFELTATVGNVGDRRATATTLRYHRSADATITRSDAAEGTGAVDELASSGSSAESITLTAPSMVGTYHYGACVDAVPNESTTDNNCSAATRLAISEPRGFDLAVGVVVNTASPNKGRTHNLHGHGKKQRGCDLSSKIVGVLVLALFLRQCLRLRLKPHSCRQGR